MNNEPEMDLYRVFAKRDEIAHGKPFVERVTKRIALLRWVRRGMHILLAGVATALLAALTPRLIDLTTYISLGSNRFADSVVAVILSPAGWLIGGGIGLFFLLRTRL
jgi:hypothetical protein